MPVMVSRRLPVEAGRAFAWVADPRTHPRWIPVTRLLEPIGDPAVGTAFTMVSGPRARWGVVDRMVVETLVAPTGETSGTTRIRKIGPLLTGTAGFVVRPEGPHRCRVGWWEDVAVTGPLPRRVTGPLVAVALRTMMWVSLRRLSRRIGGGRD